MSDPMCECGHVYDEHRPDGPCDGETWDGPCRCAHFDLVATAPELEGPDE